MSISSRRFFHAAAAISLAALSASGETFLFSSSLIWWIGLPSESRYGPPLPPRPAVSRPPVPPAHWLPPTCGAPVSSTCVPRQKRRIATRALGTVDAAGPRAVLREAAWRD